MIRLSASKLDTAFSCSWQYYVKYVLKIPDEGNKGTARGSVTHETLEQISRADRRWMAEKIKAANDPFVIPSVKRLARQLAKKYGVWTRDDFELIRNFLLVAIKLDFFLEGAEKVEIEQEFNLTGKNWTAIGFIDKIGHFKDHIEIVDYKTSKKKKSKEELDFNLQNYFYTLATRKRGIELPISFRFEFLKFPKNPIQQAPEISDEELQGFETWLETAAEYLNNFSEKNALDNTANESFKNSFKCGKKPGTIGADGNPAWVCPYRVPFNYYELYEGEQFIASSKKREELEGKRKEKQFIVQKKYEGCPVYKHEFS